MTDIELAKAIDICEKLNFFGGCRAGRELWFGKPVDVQDIDMQNFAEDVAFLKDFINRQKAEIERLNHIRAELSKEIDRLNATMDTMVVEHNMLMKTTKSEAIREFAERLKEVDDYVSPLDIDYLVKEMTEDK